MNVPLDRVFWTASTRDRPFPEQVEAAAAGGFDSIALPMELVAAAAADGLSPAAMRTMAEDNGVPVRHVETVTAWAPIRVPSGLPAGMTPRFDVPMDEVRRILDAFDVRTVLAACGYDAGAVPFDVAVEGFAAFCDEAAARGIEVDLEFMPFFGLPDLAAAWDLVRAADRPNAGILVDTWHFFRGNPDLDLLRAIPGERLRQLQLADAPRIPAVADPAEETVDHRLPPGDGDLPIAEVLAIVAGKGHLRHAGPEVFSRELSRLDPAEAGRRTAESLRRVLEEAGISGTSLP